MGRTERMMGERRGETGGESKKNVLCTRIKLTKNAFNKMYSKN